MSELNSRSLRDFGFKHFSCSREFVGRSMAYYRINSDDTVFIVLFDSSYSVYLLNEKRLLDKLLSYKRISSLFARVTDVSLAGFFEPRLVSGFSYSFGSK